MLGLSRGDTIIEVLISLAVIGMVLSFSYASANRSLLMSQTAKERSVATKLAESQIELMKHDIRAARDDIFMNGLFCMKPDGTGIRIDSSRSSLPADPAIDDFGLYHNECKHSNDLYHVGVEASSVPPASSDTYEYHVHVRWDGLSGIRNETVLRYRLVEQ